LVVELARVVPCAEDYAVCVLILELTISDLRALGMWIAGFESLRGGCEASRTAIRFT